MAVTDVDLDTSGSSPSGSLSKSQMNLVFITVMLGMLLSALDQTIVSTALPTIVGDLGGAGHQSWVVTAYMLTETVATVLAGKLGDQFGRKRLFQVSVALFVIGSFFCGLAQNLDTLIAMRAVQGIGGGGLSVSASALIGEVIPLRERGKYQGALGAVFGVTTVIGPLLGGIFTDDLSWRWCFYVNVPVAIVVIALAARTIPKSRSGGKATIDYLGILFVGLGATALILATTWGGTQYAWTSTTIIGLFVAAVILLAVFVVVENRAAEPILPMRLFRGRVFTICSILSFIVGFAMIGSITFLPTFIQYVNGVSATMSGLRTLPMVLGLLVTAMTSGVLVGRTGRYRMFPIAGSVVTAVGLFLLSLMNEHTSVVVESLYMLVLGLGIGLVMQVLTLVVQNTAAVEDLGAVTSGVSFFRTLGGSFGASVFGSIFANNLKPRLIAAYEASPTVSKAATTRPELLAKVPAAERAPFVHAYAQALDHVFRYGAPVALVGLLVALALPQVKMRGAGTEMLPDAGDGFAMPSSSESTDQFETLVGRAMRKGGPRLGLSILERSGSALDIASAWGVLQVFFHRPTAESGAAQNDIEAGLRIPPGVLTSFFDELVTAGWLRRTPDALFLTEPGAAQVRLIGQAWENWIMEQLADWLPAADGDDARRARVQAAMKSIVARIISEEQRRVQDVRDQLNAA